MKDLFEAPELAEEEDFIRRGGYVMTLNQAAFNNGWELGNTEGKADGKAEGKLETAYRIFKELKDLKLALRLADVSEEDFFAKYPEFKENL